MSVNKSSVKKIFIYLLPLVIAVIYVVAFFAIVPQIYGEKVAIIKWIFTDPSNILELLEDPFGVISQYSLVGLIILNWVLIVAFVTSLFFSARIIVKNQKPQISKNAKLVGKEPYVMALEMLEQIKSVKWQDVSTTERTIYFLCEKLKNESAFGTGEAKIIDCENEISECLKEIQNNIKDLEQENMDNIELLSQKCVSMLKVRTELKKK